MENEVMAKILESPDIVSLTTWAFSDDGPLARAGFEMRQQQRDLAILVARQIDSDGVSWALAEAPCGSGKGLAYLTPGVFAAIRSQFRKPENDDEEKDGPKIRPVVVSTANIALQEQLLKKDIPALAAALGIEIRSAMLKGRSNYLCLYRLADAEMVLSASPFVRAMSDWARSEGCTGDREDVPAQPGAGDWPKVSVTSDECLGRKCRFAKKSVNPDGSENPRCFAEESLLASRSAHVVVVNHHYLALAPARKSSLLAVDEAHELEAAMRAAMSAQVSANSGVAAAQRVGRARGQDHCEKLVRWVMEGLFARLLQRARQESRATVAALAPGWSGPDHDGWANEVIDALDEVCDLADDTIELGKTEEERELLAKAADRLGRLREEVAALADGAPTEAMLAKAPGRWAVWATWFVDRASGAPIRIEAHIAPANVRPATLALQRLYPRAALVSATLAPAGKFTAMRAALGLTEDDVAEEKVLESPFPIAKQGVLIVPAGPSPKDPSWEGWSAQQIVEAVVLAQGRTLVLCSSMRAVDRAHEALARARLPWPVKKQGAGTRAELRAWFRDEVSSVLVATRSFFQGLDVQGESCSVVIIDKAPFAVPGDPLEDAVAAHLAEQTGETEFGARTLPQVCMMLAQQSGRLIRSATDRGAVVVLDNRVIASSGMGRAMRASLPPFPVSFDLADIPRALDGSYVRAPVVGALRRRRGATPEPP